MIIGFVGTPGSGKSYEAVKKIVDNLKLGRIVYSNIDGLQVQECREHIKNYSGLDDFTLDTRLFHLTDEQTRTFWEYVQPGSLVVLDEVHKLFSNRDWASEKNRIFTEWASTHRHEGFDVVLITQDIEKIDKHARSLIEWTYLFRKVNFFGGLIQKSYLCYAYAGDDHVGKPMTKNTRSYSADIFRCYHSYGNAAVKELGIMKHANILKHPVFYAIPLMICIFGYMFSQSSFAQGKLISNPMTDARAKKDTVMDKPFPVVSSPSVPSVSSVVGSPVPSNLPKVKSPEIMSPRDVIKVFKMPNGKLMYTNNGYVPGGGLYVSTIKY